MDKIQLPTGNHVYTEYDESLSKEIAEIFKKIVNNNVWPDLSSD